MARFAKPVARLRHGLLVSGGGTGGPDPTRRQTMAPKQAIRRLHAMPRPIAPPHWPLGGHLSSPQSRRPSGLDQALRDSTHHARSARPTRRPPASTHAKIHATRTDESCHWARNVITRIPWRPRCSISACAQRPLSGPIRTARPRRKLAPFSIPLIFSEAMCA